MGLIEMASGNSVWRGMDYYENKRLSHGNRRGRILMMELSLAVGAIVTLYI